MSEPLRLEDEPLKHRDAALIVETKGGVRGYCAEETHRDRIGNETIGQSTTIHVVFLDDGERTPLEQLYDRIKGNAFRPVK